MTFHLYDKRSADLVLTGKVDTFLEARTLILRSRPNAHLADPEETPSGLRFPVTEGGEIVAVIDFVKGHHKGGSSKGPAPARVKLSCKHCGHKWYLRGTRFPTVCPNPRCKSPNWEKERRKKTESETERKRTRSDTYCRAVFDGNADEKSKIEVKIPSSQIETSAISVTGMNPRRRFDEDKMKDLVESIRVNGMLEPLLLRPKGDGYELVIGERRLRAAKELGLETVPAVIGEMTDEQVLVATLSENLQRVDLNPIEEAEGIKRLMGSSGLAPRIAAERLGKSEAWISRRLQLLEIPQDL